MTTTVKGPEERRQEKEILTPPRKKNLDETRHKYRKGTFEQLSRL